MSSPSELGGGPKRRVYRPLKKELGKFSTQIGKRPPPNASDFGQSHLSHRREYIRQTKAPHWRTWTTRRNVVEGRNAAKQSVSHGTLLIGFVNKLSKK